MPLSRSRFVSLLVVCASAGRRRLPARWLVALALVGAPAAAGPWLAAQAAVPATVAAATRAAAELATAGPATAATFAGDGTSARVPAGAAGPPVAAAGVPAAATATPAPRLRLERSLGAGRAAAAGSGATFARAERISADEDRRVTLDGRAEVRRGGAVLRADRIVYTTVDDEVVATGGVRAFTDGLTLRGPQLRMQIDAQTGTMPQADYTFAPRNASGRCEVIELLGEGRARLLGATLTTCAPGDRGWRLQARELELDRDEELAVARGGTLYFQDVPILASPYLQFPLGERRRSGVLTPSFGINTRLGFETTVPYYLNIAPNRDATIAPRVMTRRGVLLENEFRYLEPTWRGSARLDVIPNDRETGGARSLISWQHQYATPGGVNAGLNYNRVSDDRYFVDFGNTIVTAAQKVLPQEGFVAWYRPGWDAAVRVTRNQTLQDPLAPVIKPYERVPQLVFNAQRADIAGFDLALATEAARFDHPTRVTGTRLIVNPQVAYPWLAPWGYVIPRLQWHATAYALDEPGPLGRRPRRDLPLGALDAGLVFERDTAWFGRATVQTLEPRLYYAYVPFRSQAGLPNFDSALADFNFAQLFTENVFVGGDRIGQANQLTTAAVSRLLDPGSGEELVRAAIGQRFYFSPQGVSLPGGASRTDRASDLLLGLAGRLTQHFTLDLAVQHATQQRQVVRAAVGVRWSPQPASVLSLAYRYKINELEQIDVAGQWPLTSRWYGVGRVNWSLREQRAVEVLGGLEYKADCWAVRVVGQRFATAVQTATTTLFFQLELAGAGSVGTSPIGTLRRNIPGYQLINPLPPSSGRYQFYE